MYQLNSTADFHFFNCPGCRIFILCEIHCYLCPHIFWVYYFNFSQCVLVSSHDTAKLFCMLDIPKDTPLLLLIYSDLSEFISGYYAKFFFFKMYCLGKNQFNEHTYFRMVTLVVVCSVIIILHSS